MRFRELPILMNDQMSFIIRTYIDNELTRVRDSPMYNEELSVAYQLTGDLTTSVEIVRSDECYDRTFLYQISCHSDHSHSMMCLNSHKIVEQNWYTTTNNICETWTDL